MSKFINLKDFIKSLNLEVINYGISNLKIMHEHINILGPEILGYEKNQDLTLTLVGPDELNFLIKLEEEHRIEIFKKLLAKPKALVFSDSLAIPNFILEALKESKSWGFRSNLKQSFLYYKIYTYLKEKLEPRITVHATFLNIHGMGVLLQGESGIGKSETALDLIKRGHELISDDIVELFEGTSGYLIGEAPEILKHKLEIRGIGIVDVINMFGASSYYPRKKVDLVIELKAWDNETDYDRLGLDEHYVTFLSNEVRKMTIPVLPGRDLALLVESATLKAKLIKYMSIDDSKEFIDMIDSRRRNEE